jgi:hypothetical protein
MFRTRNDGFSFPYPITGADVQKARKYSMDLWTNNKWAKAVHDFGWLIEKFKPIPDWHDSEEG